MRNHEQPIEAQSGAQEPFQQSSLMKEILTLASKPCYPETSQSCVVVVSPLFCHVAPPLSCSCVIVNVEGVNTDSRFRLSHTATSKASNLIFVYQPIIGTRFTYTYNESDIRHDEEGVSSDLYDSLQTSLKQAFIQMLIFELAENKNHNWHEGFPFDYNENHFYSQNNENKTNSLCPEVNGDSSIFPFCP
ncbi:hypothetical protein JHK86_034120 [Glycine max]|nr:hypothetical protein JHK86_034120 [Glycine max]